MATEPARISLSDLVLGIISIVKKTIKNTYLFLHINDLGRVAQSTKDMLSHMTAHVRYPSFAQ
jgi:hypothetical protein